MADDDNDFEKASSRRMKFKVNMFDDDITVEAARDLHKHLSYSGEDEEEEEVNFDGTPAVKYSNKPGTGHSSESKAPMPDLSSLAVPASTLASRSTTATAVSPASIASSYGSVSSAMMFGHSRSKSLTMGSANTEKPKPAFSTASIGSNSSLQDIDECGGLKKQMSSSDIDKLYQEIKTLRQSLLSARRDRWVKLPVEDTLRRIIKGEEYSLEMYRSLDDKLELLDKATQRHDGNAIISAVLFLQRTVVKQIFTREILSRPVAANHYLNYLKAHFDHTEYINMLILLGRTEEAAVFKFRLALSTSNVSEKISKIRDSLRGNFQADPSLASESSLVQEYVDLLERQQPIDDSDASLEAAGRTTIFRDFPRKRSLINMPVVTTLYYCCLYHFHLAENSLASPEAIRKRHQISDKQFVWTAVAARAKLRQWKDIEALLTTKGFFGGTKMKSVIGFDKIVGILHKNDAPPDILEKYLVLIEDVELRLSQARKVACSKAIVDTLVVMKNRSELEAYASKLERHSKDGLYANDVLNSSSIKWK